MDAAAGWDALEQKGSINGPDGFWVARADGRSVGGRRWDGPSAALSLWKCLPTDVELA